MSTISAVSAPKAASNAYAANAAISGSSSAVTGALTGVSIQGMPINAVTPTLDLITRVYQHRLPVLLTGIALTENCAGGGTIALNGTVKSDLVATNGDTITFTATNCVESGISMNGAFKITLSGVSAAAFTGNAWSATIDVLFTAFTVTTGSDAATVNGDMKIAISQTSSTASSVAITGKSLQTSDRKVGINVASRTLTDYSVTGSAQGTAATSSANFTVSGNTSALGNFEYQVKTLQPFVSNGGAPTAGALSVSGNASSVTMTVAAPSSVRLDYSAKGDGVTTQTTTVGWAAFLANL
jgi:hypothetical protein